MPANNRQRFQQNSAKPLRSTSGPVEFTRYQLLALGCFISAMLASGHGAYVNLLSSSGTIRLRLYVEGDQWEDNVSPRDDFAVILGDYAKQFGVQSQYIAILGAGHSSGAGSASAAPADVPEGEDTAPGGAKRLRGSQGA